MRARTFYIFSQLSNDPDSENYSTSQVQHNLNTKNGQRFDAKKSSKAGQQFDIGRKHTGGQLQEIDQKCNISDRASVPAWKLLFGGARESLMKVERCTQERHLVNDSIRKGEILKFLYNADLIGKCPSEFSSNNNKVCKPSIFSLDGAKLIEANSELPMELPGVNLYRARLDKANFKEIVLSKAFLENALLNEADLSNAVLQGANMKYAKLEKANLFNADLFGANLQFAGLAGSNLKNADLMSADLRNANLRNTTLDGVKFEGARYNVDTIWPTGFNSRGKKLILCPVSESFTKQKDPVDPRCK